MVRRSSITTDSGRPVDSPSLTPTHGEHREEPFALLLVVGEDRAVLHELQRAVDIVGVDSRRRLSQGMRQAPDLVAGEERCSRCQVGESEDHRRVKVLICRVVVGHVGGVPQLFGPRQEGLRWQLGEVAGGGDGRDELVLQELSKVTASNSCVLAEVDHRARTDGLAGGQVVPTRRAGRAGVQQGAAEDVDLVLEGQLGLLATETGDSADRKVTSATPSILRSSGMLVSTPSMGGQLPGLSAARWIWRYSTRPLVAEMIPECGPLQ